MGEPLSLVRKSLTITAASALLSAVLIGTAPSAALAVPTACDPNSTWYDVASTATTLVVPNGNSIVYQAPSSADLKITQNLTRTLEVGASYSASVGGNLSIDVPVRGFNIGAGIDSSADLAMDVKLTGTRSVTQDITIPKGHAMLQYVGVRMTTTSIAYKKCNGNGTTITTQWRGTLKGPRLPEIGWRDCKDTVLC